MKELLLLRLEIEGVYPEGGAARLERAGIPVYFLKKINKTKIELCIDRKFRKKVFTNLNDSCYNIIRIEYYGVFRLLAGIRKRIGLVLGAGMFVMIAMVASVPVLRIDVVGSGIFYREKIEEILEENNISAGKLYNEKKAPLITAQILSLPDVFFCSLKKDGSTLRVEVQAKTTVFEPCVRGEKIYAAHDGVVQNVTLLRGMSEVRAGDEVKAGDLLVRAEDENSILMASVTVLVTLEDRVQANTESEAVLSLKLGHDIGESVKEVSREVEQIQEGEFWIRVRVEELYRANM